MNFAIFAGGCFWCVEAIFSQLNGVSEVISGYSGGKIKNPTYEQICTGKTDHAEVCKIIFNPDVISYEELLKVFWETHDPTTINQQGADIGSQYRSVVFYTDDDQKKIANDYKSQLDDDDVFKKPIVTEITKFEKFYKAEDYHQEYYKNNSNAPYCRLVIKPKLDKFNKKD